MIRGTMRDGLTSGAATRDEDLGRVGLVLLDTVQDHVGNGLGVAAAEVAQRTLARYVPARAAVRAAGPDGDVPLPVRPLFPRDLGILEVGLRRGLARVDHHYQRRIGLHLVRDVGPPVSQQSES
jgi:hypothetical protein